MNRIVVALTFPTAMQGAGRPIHRTFTHPSKVSAVVNAADMLNAAPLHAMCPMFLRVGPQLTVVFRHGATVLAELAVAVTLGTHGYSGASACFPIHFTSRGHNQALVGNSFVRKIGSLIGTAIS